LLTNGDRTREPSIETTITIKAMVAKTTIRDLDRTWASAREPEAAARTA
jgi:hypothetical protein